MSRRRNTRRLPGRKSVAEMQAALLAKTLRWTGFPDVPLCISCARPLSEHWDFPAICPRFHMAEREAPC